jgi:hypothetical protein
MFKSKAIVGFILLIICSLNVGCTGIKEIDGASYINYDNEELNSDSVIEKEMVTSILKEKGNMDEEYIKSITDTLSDYYSYYYICRVENASPIPTYLDIPIEVGVIYEIDDSAKQATRLVYKYKKIGTNDMNGIYFNDRIYECTYNDLLDKDYEIINGLNIRLSDRDFLLKDEFPTTECKVAFSIDVTAKINDNIITDEGLSKLFHNGIGEKINREKNVGIYYIHSTVEEN